MTDPEHPDPQGQPPENDETVSVGGAGAPGAALPSQIGQYSIKRLIAAGGMGAVYQAQQENPRRTVAVKVVKQGMASSEAIRRFQQEAQVLARLRHSGIAQIYEAGTYEEGGQQVPFFALEYIPNAKPITEYAQAKHLNIRERLDLFLQVCEAVHYGHQRGIIHRDLKPQNILVDSEGRVRIIDFGVARAVDADLKQTALQTRVGQIIGTAHYMSPEQFDADPNDLDTRSDVYALGVVLYELLSGQLPYSIESSGIFEIARIVREERPTPLSARNADLKGELETIALKALHKDREYRYQSAFGLAEDIRRYLKGEAISARPTSLSYQVRVFARRNKTIVAVASLAVGLLIAGVITSTSLYFNMKEERARAAREAERAVAASEFLKSALEAAVAPGYGDVKTVGDVCDLVGDQLDEAFSGDPNSEAEIRTTVGNIYSSLHRWKDAERHYRKAFDIRKDIYGQASEEAISSMTDLMVVYFLGLESQSAIDMQRLICDATAALYGEADSRTQSVRLDLAGMLEESDATLGEALGIYQDIMKSAGEILGESSAEALSTRATFARALISADPETAKREAEAVFFQAIEQHGKLSGVGSQARQAYALSLLANSEIDSAKTLYDHKTALDPIGIETVFQGASAALTDGIKVVVFFETWCPYSQRFVPKIVRYANQYTQYGIEFVGLTRVNRSSTDASVREFIASNNIRFPILKESGRAWNYFRCGGTPTTVLIHEGEVVWQASGAGRIPTQVFEGLLAAN